MWYAKDTNDFLISQTNTSYTGSKVEWATVKTNEELIHRQEDISYFKYKDVSGDIQEQNFAYIKNDATDALAKCGSLQIPTGWTEITLTEYLFEIAKIDKAIELKIDYNSDILWTDDSMLFYDKWKIAYPSNTDYDAWYGEVMAYWTEGRTERDLNKTDLSNATTKAQVDSILYTPTHVKTKEQIG